ncbi:MAG: hypothetical protein U1F57_04750 [bacterium]
MAKNLNASESTRQIALAALKTATVLALLCLPKLADASTQGHQAVSPGDPFWLTDLFFFLSGNLAMSP